MKYFLGTLSAAQLLELRAGRAGIVVTRGDVPDALVDRGLDELATHRKTTRAAVLLDLIDTIGRAEARSADLGGCWRWPPDDVKPVRDRVVRLTSDVSSPPVRLGGVGGDGSRRQVVRRCWERAAKSPGCPARPAGIPLIFDPDLRNKAYDRVRPLVAGEGADATVRRAAIAAAVSMTRDQKATFAPCAAWSRRTRRSRRRHGASGLAEAGMERPEGRGRGEGVVAWAKGVPAGDRTSPEYVQAVQLAGDLAGLLPAEQATAEERGYVRHVHHRWCGGAAYAPASLLRASRREDPQGQRLHAAQSRRRPARNREKVGTAAMAMKPDQLDGQGRTSSPAVARCWRRRTRSRVSTGCSSRRQEGEYEYVCTYPGHWEMMWGKLIVTRDVDAYLQSNPDASPTKAAASHEHHK